MRFKHLFIVGMPRARSKFYQAFINEELRGGVIHETQLLTHKSIKYLLLLLGAKIRICSAEVPVNYLFDKHEAGFFRARNHRFTCTDLKIFSSDAYACGALGPSSMLRFFFSSVRSGCEVSVLGVRHHMNALLIPYCRAQFPRSGFVIVTRPFVEIFSSKLIWERKRLGSNSSLLPIVTALKLAPVWFSVRLAVVFFGGRKDVLVLHHSKTHEENYVVRLCRFLEVEYRVGMGETIGVVDSSHDLSSQKPRPKGIH